MQAKIQVGQQLGGKDPKPFAEKADSEPQSAIDISVVQGSLVVMPCPEPTWYLEDLVAQVTDENLHEEVNTGSPVGREIW